MSVARVLSAESYAGNHDPGSDQQPKLRNNPIEDGNHEPQHLNAQELEMLGWRRPEQFKSLVAEILFCYSVISSQFMAEYFVSGFNVLLPTLVDELGIPETAQVWPSGAFALVTAAFLLPFGRASDMYGGYVVFIGGLAWFCVWSIIAGFSVNPIMLDFCRAIQGFGPAAFLPSSLQILGSVYRPGPRKNLAPLGFFFGILISGLVGSFLPFGWYFWIGAILISSTLLAALLTLTSDFTRTARTSMDWLGSFVIVAGLILVVFALTDSSEAPKGWKTPYIYITLIVGVLLLLSAVYIEGWIATNPLLPPDLFKVNYLNPFMLGLFFSYGCLGLFLLYSTLYMQNIMGASPIQVSAWFIPAAAGGVFFSILGGTVMHKIPGTILIFISQIGWIIASVLFALAPSGANYWAWVFPSMIGATVGIDITYTIANVFITSNLPKDRQGLAGAICNALVYLGVAVFLGFGDNVQTNTLDRGLKTSYQNVFWFELACAGFALVVLTGFVRIKSAKSEMTLEEREAARREEV